MNAETESFSCLPTFSEIDTSTIESQLRRLITDNHNSILFLEKIPNPDWGNFVDPLNLLADKLDQFWSPVRHLNSVMNNQQIRTVYGIGVKLISEYSTALRQNRSLFDSYLKIKESDNYTILSIAQKKAIEDNIRSFRLNGVSLNKEKKEKFKNVSLRLSEMTTRFADNVLDTANTWEKRIKDKSELAGLPDHALKAAQLRAKEKDYQGFLFNLEFPTYYSIQTFAEDRSLRQEVYKAYITRASDQGPHNKEQNNDELIKEILRLRAKKARLLGFENYAELSIETKMAESPKHVIDFLQDLLSKSKLTAIEEFKELEDYAYSLDKIEKIQAWDIAYYSNKLKAYKYAISADDLKPYFPVDVVIPGMFEVVKKLYGLNISQLHDIDVWHKDVNFYQIKDSSDQLRGGFYLDVYSRENKRGGAWMDECVSRMKHDGKIQHPVAYLTCNLTPPIGKEVALITHDEVITLFHEFGHGLHHILTQVDYRDVSGINGVEWDAVELPSQFMENWCWEKQALDLVSRHYVTGKKIPEELLQKAYKAKNFQSAMQMIRQLEFALFDMRIYTESTTEKIIDVQNVLNEVRKEVSVVPISEFDRFQNSFSHIFSGGYAAGYFSYKWAEVLSADAFSRFEEEGIFNPQTGKAFLHKVLEKGGTQKAQELFEDFRGRRPELSALLRHSGLVA